MKNSLYTIKNSIAESHTLPGRFYKSEESFGLCRENIFMKSWQFITEADKIKLPDSVYPFRFMEGMIDEPLIFTRDEKDQLHCLSNVCTHRGNILIDQAGYMNKIRCCYHGRCFHLNGRFISMPETDGMVDFPGEQDNLPQAKFAQWKQFLFAAIDPSFSLEDLFREMDKRVGWLPVNDFIYDGNRSQEYLVRANWALYCDNYLEGFHIPYIHKDLAKSLDYNNYSTEIFPYSNLQLGVSSGGENVFDLPESSPDYGKKIAAYYFWLFPNMMFNFYPWGLSVNIIRPLNPSLTKVIFKTYVWDESKIDQGAGALLDRVEREDEAIVEKVQQGTGSRLYKKGRFSPKMEVGVHHFHCLISRFIQSD